MVHCTWQPCQMIVMKGANQSHYFYHCCVSSYLAMGLGEVYSTSHFFTRADLNHSNERDPRPIERTDYQSRILIACRPLLLIISDRRFGLLWIRELEYKKKYGTYHSSVIFGCEQVNKWESIDLLWAIQRILLHDLYPWLSASSVYLHYVQVPAPFIDQMTSLLWNFLTRILGIAFRMP